MAKKKETAPRYRVEYPEGVFHEPDAEGWFRINIPAGDVFVAHPVDAAVGRSFRYTARCEAPITKIRVQPPAGKGIAPLCVD